MRNQPYGFSSAPYFFLSSAVCPRRDLLIHLHLYMRPPVSRPRAMPAIAAAITPAIIRSAMLTDPDILTALRDCTDPTLPCNIVDLGLIRSLHVEPDLDAPGSGIPGVPQKYRIHIELTLTHPTDETTAQLTAQIRNRLAGLEQAGEITLALVNQPPWTPQQITPEGRRILGLDGNPNLVQIR